MFFPEKFLKKPKRQSISRGSVIGSLYLHPLMKKICSLILVLLPAFFFSNDDTLAPAAKEKFNLRFDLNASGSRFFQLAVLNQTWLRFNENNPGTTRFGKSENNTFDIGLRRTRLQLFGQLTEKTFIYFQFGQNNFNAAYNSNGNRKIAAFFHDALGEYKVFKNNGLKIGAGLTIMNGLSRFSQPSISSIMTLDVPVFLQYSVDQIDQFDRRLAVYARGQIKKFDYRIYLSDPFPVNSNGLTPPPPGENAGFVNTLAFSGGKGPGVNKQIGTYLAWNFFENEPHTTPYLQGSYLGTKKVWNIAVGGVYQKNAMWHLTPAVNGEPRDTAFADMLHLCIESYLDMPLNKEKGSAISAFAGFYKMDYGPRYLRYNGLMNPANGSIAGNYVQSGAFGNAFPMFGTGNTIYAQFGYLMPEKVLGKDKGKLMPYLSAQYAEYPALEHKPMLVYDIGLNWFIKDHISKLSLDYQNRPTYFSESGNVKEGARKSCLILQYQVAF